ncbi:hypothetical protein DSLASN_04800 [Desulfoluna limicola]|uniref:Poly(3-hydroxyalkanoate) polymerase subunit PhaE n=1 Tax=Desulfoluna limicola TaxID=2810562 RepID=A0ABM7PCA9_9BACT|nr:poly(R)-hydroxyalkanoic acid synthase subunit PhaE [Desulfoluna limicola]BCS94848.1 hypothetical protein DSLASN_04800 [Desulfoluna limicola]
MTRKDQKGMDPTQFMDAVVKNSTRFWEGMAGFTWPTQETPEGSKGAGTESESFNPWEPWEPAMEAWKQFQESCSSETFADPFHLVKEEGFKKFEQATKDGWEKLLSMGEGLTPPFSWAQSPFSWAQAPFGVGASELFGGKDTFKEILKLMSGEMNRFISIPPLGLSRNYQGKVVEVVDKGNQFLLTLGEYMFLMFSPLEQAMQMVQATVKGLTDEERRSLTPESVYETWLKELEQGYFTLYGSEEYLGLLKRLVSAMGEFNLARQNYMSDCLKLMGIPSESDLDDLYRDLYSLKKKISSLENVIEKMAQSAKDAKSAERPEAPVKEAKSAEKTEKTVKEPPMGAKPDEKGEAPVKATPKADKAAKPKLAAKSADKPGKPQKKAEKPAGKTP